MGIINELSELSALRAKIKQLEGRIEYCKEQSMMIPGPMWGEEKIQTQPSGKAPFEKWVIKQLDLEREVKCQSRISFVQKSRPILRGTPNPRH